jgi:hypothetical protein
VKHLRIGVRTYEANGLEGKEKRHSQTCPGVRPAYRLQKGVDLPGRQV